MRDLVCSIRNFGDRFSLMYIALLFVVTHLTLPAFAQKNISVSVKILNEELQPMGAHIEVINSETKDKVIEADANTSGGTFSVNSGNVYVVFFTSTGCLYRSATLNLTSASENTVAMKDVVMSKMEINNRTVLQNITFDLYQKILLDESMPDIDRVVKLLNDFPKMRIEIGGFTDNFGSVSYSLKVSEERAQAVVEMLISRGIDKNRLEFKGYGGTSPIASNFTEEGRQLNNRVELKILQLDYASAATNDGKKNKKDKTKNNKKDEKTENNSNTDKNENSNENNNNNTNDSDAEKIEKTTIASEYVGAPDSVLKMDFKGMFIADKSPLANSTVNLMNEEGKVFQTTKTDKNGSFEFVGVPATQEMKFELDEKETKKYKKIFLADTTGNVIKELDKIDGEFVLSILPAEKIKMGRVYLEDPQLKLKKFKGKTTNALVIGKAVDENGTPLRAEVEAVDLAIGTTIQKTLCDPKSGEFSLAIPAGKIYDITISKTGYSFQTINVEVPEIKGFERNLKEIALQKVETGKKIVLNNIFFEAGKATLGKESYAELARVVKLLNNMQTLSIEVSGHTDNVGSSKGNKELSEQRAKAVVDYLIEKGVDAKRLTYKGYGASQPIANNKTEEGRQQNRRTEFKVLEVNLAQEAVAQNKDELSDSNLTREQLYEKFKKYDLDKNGTITYEEVLNAIDTYFEKYPKGDTKIKEELTKLFDFYFEK